MFQFSGFLSCCQDDWPAASRVSPFGHRRIVALLQLPGAFRSLTRPSSVRSGKASSVRPSLLDLFFASSFLALFSRYAFFEISIELLFLSYCFLYSGNLQLFVRPFCYVFYFVDVRFSKIHLEDYSSKTPQSDNRYFKLAQHFCLAFPCTFSLERR